MFTNSDDHHGLLKAKFGEENIEIPGGYRGNPAGKLRIMEADDRSSVELEYSSPDLKDKCPGNPQKYSSKEAQVEEEEKRSFKCKLCAKEFSSIQALGGHQNAHKAERAAMKKKEKMMVGMASALESPDSISYPNYSSRIDSHPIYGINGGKTLGVLPRSMIHKPYYSWTRAGAGGLELGHYPRWPRQQIVNQPQPTTDQLKDLMMAESNGFKLPFKTTGFNSGPVYFGMHGGPSQAASSGLSGSSSDNENFGQGSSFSPESHSETQELDLTLKL